MQLSRRIGLSGCKSLFWVLVSASQPREATHQLKMSKSTILECGSLTENIKNDDFSEIISAEECDSIFQNVHNVHF